MDIHKGVCILFTPISVLRDQIEALLLIKTNKMCQGPQTFDLNKSVCLKFCVNSGDIFQTRQKQLCTEIDNFCPFSMGHEKIKAFASAFHKLQIGYAADYFALQLGSLSSGSFPL